MQYRKLTEIKKFDNNPRYIKKEDMDKLVKSIKNNPDYFEARPIILSDRTGELIIIAGNQRYEAAKIIGLTEVPTYLLKDLTQEREKEIMIRDNVSNGEWDWELLSSQFEKEELEDWGLDIDKWKEDDIVEDEVPEVTENPVSKLGEVYQLGRHRLMCGDSTSIDAVEKLMDGGKADVTFTSPPYNANTKAGDGDIFTSKKSKKLYAEGYSDNLASSEYVDFAKSVLEICFAVTKGFIFWNVSYNANSRYEYIQQIQDRLPFLIEQICWKKSSTIPFKGSLMRDWEPIYLFSTDGEKLGLDEVVSNHWPISNTNSQAENHKACFPVELPIKGIELVKPRTGIVFEPFGGSGTTLIAAEKTGRQARLMELDPKYCDVIRKRYAKFINSEDWESATPKIL